MLRSLNQPVAQIVAKHIGGQEAQKADSDVTKGLEGKLLLAKNSQVILTANLWTKGGLVNRSIRVVKDIIYKDHGSPSLSVAVFIKFEKYNRPIITTLKGDKIVLIVPIKCS